MKNSINNLFSSRRQARYKLSGWIISICQITAARICRMWLVLFGDISVRSSVEFNSKTHYLFVANHQSQADPFAAFCALPLIENLKIAPVRFLTAKTVYYTPLLPLLKSMGCYPTRGARERIINESVDYLAHGYNVFIFPEGKRTTRALSEPRRGVSDLITQATQRLEVTMVLVHIEWSPSSFLRRRVDITIAPAPKELYSSDATTIMNHLYEL